MREGLAGRMRVDGDGLGLQRCAGLPSQFLSGRKHDRHEACEESYAPANTKVCHDEVPPVGRCAICTAIFADNSLLASLDGRKGVDRSDSISIFTYSLLMVSRTDKG